MRLLHTADWHLGDRLGRVDRTDDLRRGVERVGEYCRDQGIDVLLVAGDLFSELARPDGLRDAVRHLQDTFGPFLRGGGTVLAVTGNHDNENFCRTLCHAMDLAAPAPPPTGEPAAPGRLYLCPEPALIRLADVQFLLMPYPTPPRYLTNEPLQRYGSLAEKNRFLTAAFTAQLQAFRHDPLFAPHRPTVLVAHVNVLGAQVSQLFRLSPEEDVVIENDTLARDYAYVALGHVHKPHDLGGHAHVRYSGSIDRLDLGEAADAKGVVVVEIGADGLRGSPTTLPLDATPIYEVTVLDPTEAGLTALAGRYPDRERALVNLRVRYTAGVHDLESVLARLDELFPRWYARDWSETGELGPTLVDAAAEPVAGFAETVREYLTQELAHASEAERDAVLAAAEELIRQVEARP